MFFFWLIIIIILLVILILNATIKIEIENLIFNLPKEEIKIINQDCKVKLKIYLINKIRVVCIDITKFNTKKEKINEQIKKFENRLKKNKFKFDLSFVRDLKEIKLEKMNLQICFGLEDAAITAILIGVISIIFANFIKNKIDNLEKQKYIINPIYQNKNILNIKFDGIIVIRMRNIINIILKIIGKRSVKKNGRASHRRTYVYSDE